MLASHSTIQLFELGLPFRKTLSRTIGVEVPEGAFCAMDFHLDWIYAALCAVGSPCIDDLYSNAVRHVQGQHEDVDLLVAFESGGDTHLILIEAKATSSWTNKQAESKAKRLRGFFADQKECKRVTPHFILMSPKRPGKLTTGDWPAWMTADQNDQPLWIELPIPNDLQKVGLCDAAGITNAKDGFWRIFKR